MWGKLLGEGVAMKMKLIALLAAAALGKLVVPAAAQIPEARVQGVPCGNPPMSATAGRKCESTATFDSVLWFVHTGCRGGLDMGEPWFELAANQGPIARALGLPVPAVREKRDSAALPINACNVELGDWAISVYPFRSNNADDFQSTYNGTDTLRLLDFCPRAECPMGNIVGLPSANSEFMAVVGCDVPTCAINWNGDDRPCVQINVGASVFFTTVFGSNGVPGQHNLSQFTGAGSSIWLDCIPANGLEIRAGVTFIGGQQFIESRR
jgi:hypothetical protein